MIFVAEKFKWSEKFNRMMSYSVNFEAEDWEKAQTYCNTYGLKLLGEFIENVEWKNAEENSIYQNLLLNLYI